MMWIWISPDVIKLLNELCGSLVQHSRHVSHLFMVDLFVTLLCLLWLSALSLFSLLPEYYPQFGLWPCNRRTWSPWRASGWTRSSSAAAATSSPWSASRATSSPWPRSTPASTAGPRGCSTGRFLYLTTTLLPHLLLQVPHRARRGGPPVPRHQPHLLVTGSCWTQHV